MVVVVVVIIIWIGEGGRAGDELEEFDKQQSTNKYSSCTGYSFLEVKGQNKVCCVWCRKYQVWTLSIFSVNMYLMLMNPSIICLWRVDLSTLPQWFIVIVGDDIRYCIIICGGSCVWPVASPVHSHPWPKSTPFSSVLLLGVCFFCLE